ncbi:MAG: hypothetical protein AUH91_02545 [Verrucomicrobia bacterium 13_1_40CM_4_54_4]|nr:MAG: hypothetical protein AUH91_02545 [Verrucomicrobia bacterium 13_1_40CM_4_54_4]
MNASVRFATRREQKLILLLCVIAAVRVLAFSAAFPFFNNVDEQAHVDLVMKYARGDVPRDLGHFSAEAAYYLALYGTPEYFTAPQQFAKGEFPQPNWILPADKRYKLVEVTKTWWESHENHESGEPPLYYVIAGAWLNLGRACGIKGGWLLYWVRFLNVFVAAGLVWTGSIAAQLVFPDREFSRLSVPLLLAVWPQTAFYSIQSDVLSPLCFGIAFIGLVKLLQTELPGVPLAIWTGLALAATCLVKTANLPLLGVAMLAMIFKVGHLARTRRLRAALGSLSALVLSTPLPIALWFAWNYHIFGDLTATGSKIDFLGRTRKPLANWWPHPIFTLHGLNEFWPELMASFWRGEFIWHGQRLASAATDAFYWVSSTLAMGLTVVSLFSVQGKLSWRQREDLWLALLSVTLLVLFIIVLSIGFDFGPCVYPSNEHPYFTSGRLLCAAAVPFFLLYSQALDWVLSGIPRMWPRIILFAGIVLFILVSQALVNWPAFSSRYNFFHLNQTL